jgi:MFS family permease
MTSHKRSKVTNTPFYYGWLILVVTTLGIICSIPGQTMGIAVLTDTLIKKYSLSRTQISATYMLGTIASSLVLPFAGRLLDRLGARLMIVISCWGLGLSILILKLGADFSQWSQQHWPYLQTWLALGCLWIAFLGLRHFGQGQLTMVSRTTLARWFESRRGLATALSGLLVSLGFGSAPYVLNLMQSTYSWQKMLYLLASLVFLMGLIGYLFYRNDPESCGWQMEEGLKPRSSQGHDRLPQNKTLQEARQSVTFWIFNVGLMLHALAITAITFHISALGRNLNLTRDEAFAIFLPLAVTSTLTNMVAGYLADRISIKWHLVVMQAAMGIGILSCQALDTTWGYGLTIGGLGIAGGNFVCLLGVVWPKLFGREHLGAINGFNMGCIVFGSALGPYLYSLEYDASGRFVIALWVSALTAFAIALAGLLHRLQD